MTGTEAQLEPYQASMMQLFCKSSQKLLAVNYIHKKSPSLMFDWI